MCVSVPVWRGATCGGGRGGGGSVREIMCMGSVNGFAPPYTNPSSLSVPERTFVVQPRPGQEVCVYVCGWVGRCVSVCVCVCVCGGGGGGGLNG